MMFVGLSMVSGVGVISVVHSSLLLSCFILYVTANIGTRNSVYHSLLDSVDMVRSA